MRAEPRVRDGWVEGGLAREFPDLRLHWLAIDAQPGRSSEAARGRLRELSSRWTGARAINLRQQAIPWAYRVFFRQVGIDPDVQRTPVEDVVLDRMRHGGFRSVDRIADALVVAIAETGVAMTALDADRLEGALGLRLAADGELLGGRGRPLSNGQIVLADDAGSVGVLFVDLADGRAVGPATRRVALVAIQVTGVPLVSVSEAFWTATEMLESA